MEKTKKIPCVLPLRHFFQLLKPHITVQRKKTKNKFSKKIPCAPPPYDIFSVSRNLIIINLNIEQSEFTRNIKQTNEELLDEESYKSLDKILPKPDRALPVQVVIACLRADVSETDARRPQQVSAEWLLHALLQKVNRLLNVTRQKLQDIVIGIFHVLQRIQNTRSGLEQKIKIN